MSCERVQEQLLLLVDRALPSGEREDVYAHIGTCRQCSAKVESFEHLRAALGSMNRVAVPANVSSRLRVLASHECAKQRSRVDFAARLNEWRERASLWFDNLMRPLALPFAGGSLSALVMFSLLVPSLSFPHNIGDQLLFTHPDGEVVALDAKGAFVPLWGNVWIVRADAMVPENVNAVELTIDKDGRVTDYSLAQGCLTPALQNVIILSRFQPATFMGLPTSGKVKVVQTAPTRITTPMITVRS